MKAIEEGTRIRLEKRNITAIDWIKEGQVEKNRMELNELL